MLTSAEHTSSNKANAHQQAEKPRNPVSVALPSMSPLVIVPKATQLAEAAEPAQFFPYRIMHRDSGTMYTAKLEGATIRLYAGDDEVAYFQLQFTAHDCGFKNIYVHGDDVQGMRMGVLLTYLAARLARSVGRSVLTVLTPSGEGLWRGTGFTITAREHGPPDIVGDAANVEKIAGTQATQHFQIGSGNAGPAPKPPAHLNPFEQL